MANFCMAKLHTFYHKLLQFCDAVIGRKFNKTIVFIVFDCSTVLTVTLMSQNSLSIYQITKMKEHVKHVRKL